MTSEWTNADMDARENLYHEKKTNAQGRLSIEFASRCKFSSSLSSLFSLSILSTKLNFSTVPFPSLEFISANL